MSTPDALIERLRARTAGPKCNADGTYTVGNCPPDALCREAAAEIERLRADAARYRWLTNDGERVGERMRGTFDAWDGCDGKAGFDGAIDAAMRDATNVGIEAPAFVGRLE